MADEVVNQELSDEQIDKLAESSETARNSERPMTTPKEQVSPAPKEESFEFTHNGKPVKATRDQLIKWAQQGYNYPQLVERLKSDKTKWESERKQWEDKWGVYKQIDEYANQNKQWWDYIQNNWTNRGQTPPPQGQQPDPYAPKFQELEKKLSYFENFAQQLAQEKEQGKQKEDDQKLDQEIKSIREQHKDLDWEFLDETGKSLELRILEHAQSNGIPTFRAALRDLLHEDLLQKAATKGKLEVAKGIQERTKLGVLGTSSTPRSIVPQRSKDIRKTTYEELEQEIREELRRGAS